MAWRSDDGRLCRAVGRLEMRARPGEAGAMRAPRPALSFIVSNRSARAAYIGVLNVCLLLLCMCVLDGRGACGGFAHAARMLAGVVSPMGDV